jgi:hypothetical protein
VHCLLRQSLTEGLCVCGQPGPIQVGGRDGEPDVRRRCYRPPVDRCHVRGRELPCVSAGTPKAVCWSCRPRRVDRCAVCLQDRPVKTSSPIGPLRQACEWRRLRARLSVSAAGSCAARRYMRAARCYAGTAPRSRRRAYASGAGPRTSPTTAVLPSPAPCETE